MIVNRPLAVPKALDLLEQLGKTTREFAALEDAIGQRAQTQRMGESKQIQAEAQARAARLEAQIAAVASDIQLNRDRVQARFEQRETRIRNAHKAGRKRALDAIDQQEGRHRFTVQKRTLDAERQRESALAAANSQLEQVRAALALSQDQFAHLEQAAHQAFSSVAEFRHLLDREKSWPEADQSVDELQLLTQLGQLQAQTQAAVERFRRNLLAGFFRVLPVWLLILVMVLGASIAMFALPYYGVRSIPEKQGIAGLAGALALVGLGYLLGKKLNRPAATAIARDLATARQWQNACWQKAELRQRQDQQANQIQMEKTIRELNENWAKAQTEAARQRILQPQQLDEQRNRATATNIQHRQRALNQLAQQRQAQIAQLEQSATAEAAEAEAAHAQLRAALDQKTEVQWQELVSEWRRQVEPLWAQIQAANQLAMASYPEWDNPTWRDWVPPTNFPAAAKFGQIEVDLEKLSGVSFKARRLAFPGPLRFALPLQLLFPDQGSLLLETQTSGAEEAAAVINSTVFRLLALGPPGKFTFTVIDPTGLGQNFAGLMHLADYEESQINSRIWTQTSQIEERLAELTEHMEKVIQMYLRNEYATIAEYNAQAGSMAEKYHFLVIAGFPAHFSETAARRLSNIASSGARCGVYTLVHWDRRRELPHDFIPDELRQHSIRLCADHGGFGFPDRPLPGTRVVLDSPPSPQFATEFLHRVGQSTKNSTRVELPFEEITPAESERWTRSAAEEFRIPIGRTGATKLQFLALGKGTRQHALLAGKTGSGKSTLFHVLITNAALSFSPDEIEFYLVDFKKGVEFKCYANQRLPHAKVVAIESDREFGLSVLQRIDDELRRRGDLFRSADVQDLAGFRKAAPTVPLPRVLLLIDEFQEFFTEEDRISQSAAVLLDRIVRQGRAFGIHVLLGSQTLGGAYTLARATIGQMVVRIALQTNEADAYLIMDESNAAPRLLSRPGEGIYNDLAGAIEGNSPFQTAWLSDEVRDQHLVEIRAHADKAQWRAHPLVFEGNAPANLSENEEFQRALDNTPTMPPTMPRIWLGAPNAIKGPTAVDLSRQSGANLLVVGQSPEALLGMPAMALLSLAAQYPPDSLRLILIESTAPGSAERAFLDRLIPAAPHTVLRPKRHELPELMTLLAQEILQRTGEEPAQSAPATFLIFANLQDYKLLRQEDDFSSFGSTESANPAASFLSLITDGPSKGCHVIASVDTYSNVSRCLGRKALSEFQSRVLFQMGASDSASLIDSPEASNLGLHRALLFNEREGYIEKFRPYDLTI